MKHMILLSFIIILLSISQLFLHLFPVYGVVVITFVIALFAALIIYDIADLAAEEIFAYASVLPLFSLLSYSLPWITGTYYILFIYGMLLIVSELFYSFMPLKMKFYHSKYLIWIPVAVVLGGVLAVALSNFSAGMHMSVYWVLPLLILIAVSESIYFQGLVQNATTFLTGKVMGVLFTVFLYGLFHASSNFQELLLALFFITTGSLLYLRWNNLYVLIIYSLSFHLIYFFITQSLFI